MKRVTHTLLCALCSFYYIVRRPMDLRRCPQCGGARFTRDGETRKAVRQ